MMKKFYLLVMLFAMVTSYFGQQTFALKDNKNEVFGYAEISGINGKKDYFLNGLGESNLRTKNIKLVLKDINLNKIDDMLLKFEVEMQDFKILYNKNSFLITGKSMEKGKCLNCNQYFIYDLKTNKLSKLLNIPTNVVGESYAFYNIFPIENVGYLFFGSNTKSSGNYINYAIDDTGKELYTNIKNNSIIDKQKSFIIKNNRLDKNVLSIIYMDDGNSSKVRYHLLIIDTSTGKQIKDVLLDDDKYRYEPKTLTIKNEKIYIFGDVYNAGKKLEGDSVGFFMTTADKHGEIIDKKLVPFSDLKIKLDIDKNGEIKNSGFIYAHEFVMDDTSKNIVMAGEYFKSITGGTSLGNLIFLEFNENFEFKNKQEIVKTHNSFARINGKSREVGFMLKEYGYLDYMFSDILDKNRGLTFFYANITSKGLFKVTEYNYGTVVYTDGLYKSNNIIKFNSKIPMQLLPSKPGYFLLLQLNEKGETEKRIEKINY